MVSFLTITYVNRNNVIDLFLFVPYVILLADYLFFFKFGYLVGPRQVLYYNTLRLLLNEEVSNDLIISVDVREKDAGF